MDKDTEITVIKVGALDKYHAADLADDAMEAVQRKVGEAMLYRMNNEDMVSADAVDAIATDRFQRIYWGIDVEAPVAEVVQLDKDDKSTWLWSATARARNIKAGMDQAQDDRAPKVSDGWNVGVGETPFTLPEKDGGGYTVRDKDGNIVYSQKVNVHARKAAIRKAIRNAKMRCLGPQEIQEGLAKIKKSLEDPMVAEKIKAARRQMGHPEGGRAPAKSESSPAPASSDPLSPGAGGGDGPRMASDKQVKYAGGLAAQISRAAGGSEAEQRSARKSAEDEVRAMTMASAVQRITELKEEAGK